MHAEILLTIKLNQQLFADPKRIALLQAIHQTGSINQAAKHCAISYKSAWDHLSQMNEISQKPLFERNVGGKKGGGTVLTSYAKRLLQLYALLADTQQRAFAILQDEHIPLDDPLSATAKFALKSSARNQFFGSVVVIHSHAHQCDVQIQLANFSSILTARITTASCERLDLMPNKAVMLMIKAPWLQLHTEPYKNCSNGFWSTITAISDKGENQEITLQQDGLTFFATATSLHHWAIGQRVWLSVDPEQIVLLTL